MTSSTSPHDAAAQLAGAIYELCRQRADQILASRGLNVRAHEVSGTQEKRRLSALARLQASEEVIAMLRQAADFDMELAIISKATYVEIGAACGISRQAARKRYSKRLEERRRLEELRVSRPAPGHDEDLGYDDWPPRTWRFRAPKGFWTVNLIGGPADSQSFRVAVGDDAFVHIGRRNVFGESFACWARYSPISPGDIDFHFTNEYYLR